MATSNAFADLVPPKKKKGAFDDLVPKKDEDVDFSIAEMAKNIPSSAYQYGADTVDAIVHPIRTAKAVGGLTKAMALKAIRNYQEAKYGLEDAPAQENEAMADAAIDHYKGRYGSVNALKRTLMQDPVGALADASGVTSVGAAARIPRMAGIAAALEPVNVVSKTARTVAKTALPKSLAPRMYESAAKFSTVPSPERRAATVQTALDEGIVPNERGAAKLQGRLDVLDSELDALIAQSTQQNVQIPANAVFSHFKALRNQKGGMRIEAKADLEKIDDVARKFSERLNGRQFVTPAELQTLKTDLYKKIYEANSGRKKKSIKPDTYSALARGAKDAIVSRLPETEAINQKLGDLLELKRQLPKAINRIENRDLVPYRSPIVGGLVGSVVDSTGAGVAAGTIAAMMGNPKVKARIAIGINKIKQGDIGWLDQNLTAAEARVALSLAGRQEEEQEEPK